MITKTPNICGGCACLEGTRMPVWSIVTFSGVDREVSKVQAAYPHLTEAQILEAFKYADEHKEEIELNISDNQNWN